MLKLIIKWIIAFEKLNGNYFEPGYKLVSLDVISFFMNVLSELVIESTLSTYTFSMQEMGLYLEKHS